MKIQLNGESRQVPDGQTVRDLLAATGIGTRQVAVEVNGEILPAAAFAGHALQPGDTVEIVHFVGGG